MVTLRSLFGRLRPGKQIEKPSRRIRALYDAAQESAEMGDWWSSADYHGPNLSTTRAIRDKIKTRARYEYQNNSYCAGVVNSLAYDTIGSGPKLHMKTGDTESDQMIEDGWMQWSRETCFPDKLRTLRIAKCVDGAGCGLAVNNSRLSVVQLDLKIFEDDLIRDPYYGMSQESVVDGIELDRHGNPRRYHLLDRHPNDGFATFDKGSWYKSSEVFFIATPRRPGQIRPVSELAPALNLFGLLRRYTLAVLGAAESAANLAAVMKTNSSPECEADEVEPFLPISMERRGLMSLPFGWDIQAFKSDQPTTTYAEFKRELLMEIARCLNVPINIVTADSSSHNYASGRLDHQLYFKSITIERRVWQDGLLEPLFDMWLREFLGATSGISPTSLDISDYRHMWSWDRHEHVDPEKETAAYVMQWEKGWLTDDEYLMEVAGKDPEAHWKSMEEQVKRRKTFGLPMPGITVTEQTGGDGKSETSKQASPRQSAKASADSR